MPWFGSGTSGDTLSMLTILLIILVVILLFGGVGYGRRGRRRL